MNTLTHALIGATIFGRPTLTLSLLSATLAGAALPDVYIIVMVIWEGVVNQISESEMWDVAYYSEPWVTLSALTNSFFLFGALFLFSLWRGWRWGTAFAGTALLHFAGDLFLHYDDGHAHFWPLSKCVFYSPVSYWDPDHFGVWWTCVELGVSAALLALIWRQQRERLARIYASVLVGLFWLMSAAFLIFILTGGGRDDRQESSAPDKFAQPACPGSIDVAIQVAQSAGTHQHADE